MQHPAMTGILHNVMPQPHQQQAGDEHQRTEMRRSDKGQPGILAEQHGGQQNEDLVDQHPPQDLGDS